MKNADNPAMPVTPSASIFQEPGLTKREHFAALAMHGLASACSVEGEWTHDPNTVASEAIGYADALLAKLEETK